MNRHDPISSRIWFIAGLGILAWSVLTLRVGTLSKPGPGFFPIFCGVVICILASIVVYQARRNRKEVKGERLYEKSSLVDLISTVGILTGYALLLERLGFLVTTFIVLLFIFKKISKTPLFLGIVESLLATGACYFVFGYLLKTPVPKGWFGI